MFIQNFMKIVHLSQKGTYTFHKPIFLKKGKKDKNIELIAAFYM